MCAPLPHVYCFHCWYPPTLALIAAYVLFLSGPCWPKLGLALQDDKGCLPVLRSFGWLEWGWMLAPKAVFLGGHPGLRKLCGLLDLFLLFFFF